MLQVENAHDRCAKSFYGRNAYIIYLLDRRDAHAVGRLKLPSAPGCITLRGTRLDVRTHDHDLVVPLRA